MDKEEFDTAIDEMPEDVLQYVAQAFAPWTSPTKINGESLVDEDGFLRTPNFYDYSNFNHMQFECWKKSIQNPQLSSHVRDVMGSLTGYGWSMDSHIEVISDVMYEEMYDVRNELFKNIPKFVARSEIEGELFLAFTAHLDGFVEIDFMSPRDLQGGGDHNSGIFFHPKKSTMPLFYKFNVIDDNGLEKAQVFPSIYVAHYPELLNNIPKKWQITPELLKSARAHKRKYKNLGYYKTFIVAWDKSFLTARNLSHISTTIEWINYYVDLKKWEIDHKKSAGSYLWVVSLTDSKALRTWLKMSPQEKAETGLTAKKTPGGTLVLPPGVQLDVKNPSLSPISEQDTDIMHMVTSGLNKPEDMVTGQTKGDTFSGIKASRGPQSDRVQDQIAYFERFLRYDFWRSIFVLRNKMTGFKLQYKQREAHKFVEGEPKYKNKKKWAWELIDFDFPTSEVADAEGKAKAYLGVKHASLSEVLGIPKAVIAKKLGIGNYYKRRLEYATEADQFPDLPTTAELDSIQEKAQEPSVNTDQEEIEESQEDTNESI